MENIKRILVVNRLTAYSRDAVQAGISVARKYRADLFLLHLVENPVDQEALNAPLPYKDERHKSYLSVQQAEKDELDKILRNSELPIKMIIRDGKPADEIAKVVKEQNIDLLVMLAHEESRLEHTLFGGDDDKIIRRMPCSMLLVKREPDAVKW